MELGNPEKPNYFFWADITSCRKSLEQIMSYRWTHESVSMCQEPPHGEIRALLHNYFQRPNALATLHRQLQFSRPPETLKTADGDGGRGTTLWRN